MKNTALTNQKIKYTIDKKSFFGHSAILLMAMAVIFRFIGCWGYWNDMLKFVMHFAIPAVSGVLMILCISFLGKKGFFLSCVPVVLGVVFFIYRAFSFESRIHMVLCILLYLAVAVLYTGTVIGSIQTKWLLPPLFGLPFIYHIVVEDLPALSNTAVPVTFADGMQEMSILCIMAALFCVGIGLKKHVISTETTIIAEPAMTETEAETGAVTAEAAAETQYTAEGYTLDSTAPVCGMVDGQMQCEGEPVLPEAEAVVEAPATENTETDGTANEE